MDAASVEGPGPPPPGEGGPGGLSPGQAARVDAHWATLFGVEPERVHEAGTHLSPRPFFAPRPGIAVLRHGAGVLVRCSMSLVPALSRLVVGVPAERLLAPGFWLEVFGEDGIATDGTHAVAYCGTAPAADDRVVELAGGLDHAALAGFRRALTAFEWREVGFELPWLEQRLYGFHEGGELLAVAAAQSWDEGIRNVTIATVPAARGRGLGRAAAAAALRSIVAEGHVAQWQARVENAPSLALARSLGFKPFGEHLVIRPGEDNSGESTSGEDSNGENSNEEDNNGEENSL